MDFGDGIALVALGLSGYATWRTIQFNKRQDSLVEIQNNLNKLLLAKETEEVLEDLKADLGASIIKIGNGKYRLRIWNKGNADARNVKVDFPNDNHIVDESELLSKFPYECLEKHGSIELIAFIHSQTPKKQTLLLRWSDGHRNSNEKLVYPTW
ncbi:MULTISPECIES: hypothetical protein [Aliivibrio]|uniref:Uncharacterized protein n=1 Tax=Aliivibrio finisterrensis TaxID=511998 RepID=A0A4Q5KL51_9GAMM|nr:MULTISPECIES: hypothetical protein [Aliivibrio]MDD9180708.1 hypothetical protein [Aliivibrio sp. A6]RYU47080.1 hypothetical protein ERW57_18850 [Aliivibrio finisterrensis]RYU47822.1 hypothetical protein ERW56_19010 [Aliivibrio finisterrensis]RYU52536.1 hypothetical protein ERW50_19150 [Aliivibrio finisterrensis]RYU59193.1 hypothetical protein ERW53_20160 [Aliivibrio finisterrensis]